MYFRKAGRMGNGVEEDVQVVEIMTDDGFGRMKDLVIS